MDKGQAFALVVFGLVASTAFVPVIFAVIRARLRRRDVYALIRQDLAEVRHRHAHLHPAPSGAYSPSAPDGPQAPHLPASPRPGRSGTWWSWRPRTASSTTPTAA